MTDETELLALVERWDARESVGTLIDLALRGDGNWSGLRALLSALTQESAAREAAEGERDRAEYALAESRNAHNKTLELYASAEAKVRELEAKAHEVDFEFRAKLNELEITNGELDRYQAKATALEAEVERLKGSTFSEPDQSGDFVGDIWFGHPIKRTLGTHRWNGTSWDELPDETVLLMELLAEARAKSAALQADIARKDAALAGFGDDYMTSEAHHPGYVLIPTDQFKRVRAALLLHAEGKRSIWRSPDTGNALVDYKRLKPPRGPPSPPLLVDPYNGQLWRFDMAGRLQRAIGRASPEDLVALHPPQDGEGK
jgi:hypothetical protein